MIVASALTDRFVSFLQENPRPLERVSIYVSLMSAGFLLINDVDDRDWLSQFVYAEKVASLSIWGIIFLALGVFHVISFFEPTRQMRRWIVGVKVFWSAAVATSVVLAPPFTGSDVLYIGYFIACACAFWQLRFGRFAIGDGDNE